MKLHAGDTVLIISGKDRGKTGAIMRVMEEDMRVVVAGVNMRTKHVKKTTQQAGRIVKFEASISASNVMIFDPKTGKPARIGYKVDEKGKKIRVSKISGEEVKYVKPKKETAKAVDSKKEIKASKDAKDAEESKETIDTKAAPGKKSPFWKRMGFTAGHETGEVKEGAHMKEDHSIPDQQVHVRSGGRGS